MARPKKQVKLKEPIKIRLKSLADGNKSIYLDIYWKGARKYEYLKLYLVPEVNPLCKEQNKETMAPIGQVEYPLHKLMIEYNACSVVDKYRQVDVLLNDGMSLDTALFLSIIRIASCAPKYLREKAYCGRVHHVKFSRTLLFRDAVR